jgi:tetratricopeptide (TPR) repeat protein
MCHLSNHCVHLITDTVFLFYQNKLSNMKKIILALVAICLLQQVTIAQLTTTPNGGNKKAMVGERIGLTDITIHYDRPAVKGREGKIWGQLVPYGFTDLGFGTSKAAPWRAGANENTTIEFSTDVKVEGKDLPAGKYAFFIAVGKDESTLIFSKNNSAWGSFFYNQAEDALRVNVKQQPLDKPVEYLEYTFINQTPNSATVALQWEKLMFPFKIETDVNKAQIASFRRELQSDKGFDWQAWAQAANWTADNNTNLEEGLEWADYAVNGQFIGEKNFRTLATKARLLSKLNRKNEADSLMKEASALGNMTEVHGYGRQLLADKRYKEASDIFKANYKKYPNVFTTNMGMARGLSGEGKYKEALKYATAALPQAPDVANKNNVQAMIEKLTAGQDIN